MLSTSCGLRTSPIFGLFLRVFGFGPADSLCGFIFPFAVDLFMSLSIPRYWAFLPSMIGSVGFFFQASAFFFVLILFGKDERRRNIALVVGFAFECLAGVIANAFSGSSWIGYYWIFVSVVAGYAAYAYAGEDVVVKDWSQVLWDAGLALILSVVVFGGVYISGTAVKSVPAPFPDFVGSVTVPVKVLQLMPFAVVGCNPASGADVIVKSLPGVESALFDSSSYLGIKFAPDFSVGPLESFVLYHCGQPLYRMATVQFPADLFLNTSSGPVRVSGRDLDAYFQAKNSASQAALSPVYAPGDRVNATVVVVVADHSFKLVGLFQPLDDMRASLDHRGLTNSSDVLESNAFSGFGSTVLTPGQPSSFSGSTDVSAKILDFTPLAFAQCPRSSGVELEVKRLPGVRAVSFDSQGSMWVELAPYASVGPIESFVVNTCYAPFVRLAVVQLPDLLAFNTSSGAVDLPSRHVDDYFRNQGFSGSAAAVSPGLVVGDSVNLTVKVGVQDHLFVGVLITQPNSEVVASLERREVLVDAPADASASVNTSVSTVSPSSLVEPV